MASTTVGSNSSEPVVDNPGRAMDEFALPMETDGPAATSAEPASSLPPSAAVSTDFQTTPATADEPDQDMTVAIALVVTILVVVIVFTLLYVLYQRRRQLCGRGQRDKNKPDLSANEVLITPVKANGGTESSPAGLVSGPRESRSRQAVPRKWYDSAALKYMDQSTDTLDRV